MVHLHACCPRFSPQSAPTLPPDICGSSGPGSVTRDESRTRSRPHPVGSNPPMFFLFHLSFPGGFSIFFTLLKVRLHPLSGPVSPRLSFRPPGMRLEMHLSTQASHSVPRRRRPPTGTQGRRRAARQGTKTVDKTKRGLSITAARLVLVLSSTSHKTPDNPSTPPSPLRPCDAPLSSRPSPPSEVKAGEKSNGREREPRIFNIDCFQN